LIRPLFGLVIVGLGAALGPFDGAVNLALPAITAHFGLALSQVQWLVICYVLVYGTLMLVCGKLGDLFGHRLIFRVGLISSAAGCTLCALAPDWSLVLCARASQGVGTALVLSCGPALATSLYPEQRRVAALAGFAASQALAAAAGPLLGGVLIALSGWQAVFWVRVPIALAALAASGLLPRLPRRPDTAFDALGAGLLALWMSAAILSLAFAQRDDIAVGIKPALLLFAVLGFAAFVWREQRFSEPIIRPALFADPTFAVPNVMNLLANLASFAILLLTPYYLLNELHLSVAVGGMILAVPFVGAIGGASLAARLVPRLGQRRVAFAGAALQAVALIAVGRGTADTSLAAVIVVLMGAGIGQGLMNVAYTDIVTGTLAQRDRGVAGSLALLTRTLGIVIGASVLSALFAAGAGQPAVFVAGYGFAFTVAGAGLATALLVSCLWPRAWFASD
jgi:MFS family permease